MNENNVHLKCITNIPLTKTMGYHHLEYMLQNGNAKYKTEDKI